jgi:hypothetical protein
MLRTGRQSLDTRPPGKDGKGIVVIITMIIIDVGGLAASNMIGFQKCNVVTAVTAKQR